jgi:hypothetical protein
MVATDWLSSLRIASISRRNRFHLLRRKRRLPFRGNCSVETLENRIALGDVFGVSAFLGGAFAAGPAIAALNSSALDPQFPPETFDAEK